MFRIGEYQKLQIARIMGFGAYLEEEVDVEAATAAATRESAVRESAGKADRAADQEKESVLLPRKQVPEGAKIGDELEVFLYRDSEDRLIATVNRPLLTLGEVARLTVKDVTKIGAFVDIGLERDVLLPYREQTCDVMAGDSVLCALYADKSDRLAVTMNVYEYLSTDSPYKADDAVTGTIYEDSDNFGLFVAVDDKYSALIPKKEIYGDLTIGKTIQARVMNVREDGKLNLSVRQKAVDQMGPDADKIMAALEAGGGTLPFTDKADSELIRERMQMSKNEFKRACGRLLKEGKIRIEADHIRKI